jgi:hypothetical protein
MPRYLSILGILLAMSLALPALAQKPQPVNPPAGSAAQPANDTDMAAMQADLKNMRSILDQMKENLALVGSTTTPLYHQLRLEVDLWQALLDHMDRHLAEMKDKK